MVEEKELELKKLREYKEKVSGYGKKYRDNKKVELKMLRDFYNKWNGKVIKGVEIK